MTETFELAAVAAVHPMPARATADQCLALALAVASRDGCEVVLRRTDGTTVARAWPGGRVQWVEASAADDE